MAGDNQEAGEWCLIESDPGVFTILVRKFGAKGVQFEEIWSMENTMFHRLKPVHGLIFLFKYLQNDVITGNIITDPDLLKKIFFAKQMINNACATQAIVSLLMNCEHPDLDLGPELTKLKEFCRTFDSKMRGLALSNSKTIRDAHNSNSQMCTFELNSLPNGEVEDSYHYVSYVPVEGRIVELDGLREGPIDHGPIQHYEDWLDVVRPIITARIQKYTKGEICFSLLALVSDRQMIYERQLSDFLSSSAMLGMDPVEINIEETRLQKLVDIEKTKVVNYNKELARRRHNYLPFILNLMMILAKEKKLTPIIQKYKEHAVRRGTKRLKA